MRGFTTLLLIGLLLAATLAIEVNPIRQLLDEKAGMTKLGVNG
jgi:hypothetical protein